MKLENIMTIGVFNKNSAEVADNYPYKEQEDLRFVAQVLSENSRFIITYPILESMGMTEEEMWAKAEENTIQEFKCTSLAKMLHLPEVEDAPTMMVCTNTVAQYGAGLIYSQKLLDRISEVMQDDFYIIPSSVHEVLCINRNDFTPEDVNAMIQDVNQRSDCLSEAEVLSDTVYVRGTDGLVKVYA